MDIYMFFRQLISLSYFFRHPFVSYRFSGGFNSPAPHLRKLPPADELYIQLLRLFNQAAALQNLPLPHALAPLRPAALCRVGRMQEHFRNTFPAYLQFMQIIPAQVFKTADALHVPGIR